MRRTTSGPDLFTYLDYRAYLRDWFEARKRVNPKYSHRMFARIAGFRSSSVLMHVMKGERNLSPESVEAFAGAMKLSNEERAFFRALVDLGQARSDDERNDAWTVVAAQRRFREARRLEGDSFRFLSHWYYPAIHQLAARPDFRDDPTWVAEHLRPRITRAQAAEALEALFALGMLERDDEGRVQPLDASVVTPAEVSDLAACNYHREMAQRAHEAVQGVDPEHRHLLGLTVAVPMGLVPVLKEELDRVQSRLLDLCDGTEGLRDRVFQINLQLVPLSDQRGVS